MRISSVVRMLAGGAARTRVALYVHLPFCAIQCPYCPFAVVPRSLDAAPSYATAIVRELQSRLPSALVRQVLYEACRQEQQPPSQQSPPPPSDASEPGNASSQRPIVSSVYFGGGTPSRTPEIVAQVLDSVYQRTDVEMAADVEITAEANPCDRDRYHELRAAGVNRLSIGVQSFDDDILRSLGRKHNRSHAIEAVERAHALSFSSVSVDLMFGVPHLTPALWLQSLRTALALQPHHMSVYGLHVYGETAFGARQRRGALPLPTDDEQADMMLQAHDVLTAAGFQHYEISNFARSGWQCRHSLHYWHRLPYLGLGVGAHSFLGNERLWNESDLHTYLRQALQVGSAVAGRETLSASDTRVEQVMLGLRLPLHGVPAAVLGPEAQSAVDRMVHSGWLQRCQHADGIEHVCLTRAGLPLADRITAELLPDRSARGHRVT